MMDSSAAMACLRGCRLNGHVPRTLDELANADGALAISTVVESRTVREVQGAHTTSATPALRRLPRRFTRHRAAVTRIAPGLCRCDPIAD